MNHIHILLYPETLGAALTAFGETTLVEVAKTFAGNVTQKGRFTIIQGVFNSEDVARKWAEKDLKARGIADPMWAFDYIVETYKVNTRYDLL